MPLKLKSKKPESKAKKQQTDYEQLGRMLANIYETGYIDRNQAYKMSFLKGVLAGFGGVVGATVIVSLVIWVLTLFSDVSLIENIRNTLQSKQ